MIPPVAKSSDALDELDEEQLAAEVAVPAGAPVLIDEGEGAADGLAVPHQHIHQLGGGAARRLLGSRGGYAEAAEQTREDERGGPTHRR